MMHLSFATQFRVKSIPNHINHCSITFILQENLRQRLFIRHLQAICREQLPCCEADHLTDANIDPFQLRPSAAPRDLPAAPGQQTQMPGKLANNTNMCVLMYIYIYVCVYIYYIYIMLYIYIYMCVCVCVCVMCIFV